MQTPPRPTSTARALEQGPPRPGAKGMQKAATGVRVHEGDESTFMGYAALEAAFGERVRFELDDGDVVTMQQVIDMQFLWKGHTLHLTAIKPVMTLQDVVPGDEDTAWLHVAKLSGETEFLEVHGPLDATLSELVLGDGKKVLQSVVLVTPTGEKVGPEEKIRKTLVL